MALAEGEELLPVQPALVGGAAGAAQDHHPLDCGAARCHGRLGDGLEVDLAALAPGDVGGEQRAGAGQADAVGQRAGAEAGEHHQVDGADAHGRQHQHDGLRAGRHVDRDAVALADAHAAQGGGGPLDGVQQLGVGEHAPLAALCVGDQGGMAGAAALDVAVEAVVGEVGGGAAEPREGRRRPLEHPVPAAEPRQLLGRLLPQPVGVLQALPLDRTDRGADNLHRVPPAPPPTLAAYSLDGGRARSTGAHACPGAGVGPY